MPSRWWIPIMGVRPEYVRLEHLHAAVSAWFDLDDADHTAVTKPYSLSPLGAGRPHAAVGLEVGTLTDAAVERLHGAIQGGRRIRLGSQAAQVGNPQPLAAEAWEALGSPSGARQWQLEFVTPTTFRSRNRSSPWPAPAAVLRGLADSWNSCAPMPDREVRHRHSETVWVSDLDGRSEVMTLTRLRVSGFVGTITYRCDEPETAELVDALFRLAPYSGVGSARARGLGVTRLISLGHSADRERVG